MIRSINYILILLLAISCSRPTSITLTRVNSGHLFDGKQPFQQCHASTMINTKENRYLFAWFAGKQEKDDDVGIWMADGEPGKWSAVRLAVKIRNDPHWNPVLFKTPNNRIYLFFKVGKEIDFWETWYQYSDDEGRTWSDRKRVDAQESEDQHQDDGRTQPGLQ